MSNHGTARARTWSVRTYLILLVVGTTVPVLLLAGWLARRVITDNRNAIEQQLLQAARAQAALVDAELVGSVRALQGLAQSTHLSSGDLRASYNEALGLLATQPAWSAIALTTPDGRHLWNSTQALDAALPPLPDDESLERSVSTGKPAIGNLRRGILTQALGFPIRVPVVRDGRSIYVLSAWITSGTFADVLRHRDNSLSEGWVRAVLDGAGIVVARSRDTERFVGSRGTAAFLRQAGIADEGVFRDVALDGTPVYGAFCRSNSARWIGAVAVPASLLDASFNRTVFAVAGLAVLLLASGGAGSYMLSRRISRDISASAADAEAIVSGGVHPRAQSSVREIQRLSDALARSAELLEARRRERDEQLTHADQARAQAEAADRSKDQFLAMLGHELRNPLAPALTAIELMKLKGVGASTHERDVIERQIRHMARLVDDLLDASRLRRGSIELRREPIELSDAVARAVEMTAPQFAAKQHRLDVEVKAGLVVDADRTRLAQVFSNLLSNAAKYTETGGMVSVLARVERDEIVIDCRDTGIGVAAGLLPHVFDLFVQGERGLDRREGGLGLGLAVARLIVEQHGGRISVASDGPGRGATFTVRLPAAATIAAVPSVTSSAPHIASARAARVLVVDDNQDAVDMLVTVLKRAGLDAVGACSADEAIESAMRRLPHVAILDIGLPGTNGFELAWRLRSMLGHAPPRLIALTGYGQKQDAAAARAAGFDAFFVKPVDADVLLAALGVQAATAG
jgi:signal transduction histidine kinase/ActR/RegA family two-component response regulator